MPDDLQGLVRLGALQHLQLEKRRLPDTLYNGPYMRKAMRYRSWSSRLLLASLAFICASTLAEQSRGECELRVGWDDWPPYIVLENGQFHGLEYDLLIAAADAAGCSLHMIQVPWVRALKMLNDGSLDLLYGAGYSKERDEFAQYSLPYRQEQFVLVTMDEAYNQVSSVSLYDWIQSASALGGQRNLGLFRGNFYGKRMERILHDNTGRVELVYLGSNEQMIEMLIRNRLDGFIIEDGVAQMLAQTSPHPIRRLVISEQVADPLHYIFSLGIPGEVIERFNAAIRERQQQ